MKSGSVITIGYAKQALKPDSRERERMLAYGALLEELHVVVFTRKSDELPAYSSVGNVHFYGTNTKTRIGALVAAVAIVRRILRGQKKIFVLSSQDPFETSLVARWAMSQSHQHQVQLHGDFYGTPAWQRERVSNRLRTWYGLYVLRRVTHIRVVSKRIKASLIKQGINDLYVTVLPIAITIEKFLAVGRERKDAEGDTFTFLYVGRLAPEKNLIAILKAFHQVSLQHANARLNLVGAGSEETILRDFIAKHGLAEVVKIIPWTEDVPAEMAKASVFVLPSHHEGYGLVLIEAMAAGLPVITTDVGCVGEYVHDGVEGVVVEGRAESFTLAMEQYLMSNSLYQSHREAAHQQGLAIQVAQENYEIAWKASLGL